MKGRDTGRGEGGGEGGLFKQSFLDVGYMEIMPACIIQGSDLLPLNPLRAFLAPGGGG